MCFDFLKSEEVKLSDADFLQEEIDGSMNEMISFFSNRVHANTKQESRERFVFHKEDVDYVMSKVADPSILCVKEEYDDVDVSDVFCYIIDFKPEVIKYEKALKEATRLKTKAQNKKDKTG